VLRLLRCREARVVRRLSNALKQRERCIKAATALLEQGTSVVVGKSFRNPARQRLHGKSKLKLLDNTNADAETRAVWVNLAKKRNVPIRCIHFTAPAKVCEHNDTVRALNPSSEVSPNARGTVQVPTPGLAPKSYSAHELALTAGGTRSLSLLCML
jgi:predicted kinase